MTKTALGAPTAALQPPEQQMNQPHHTKVPTMSANKHKRNYSKASLTTVKSMKSQISQQSQNTTNTQKQDMSISKPSLVESKAESKPLASRTPTKTSKK